MKHLGMYRKANKKPGISVAEPTRRARNGFELKFGML